MDGIHEVERHLTTEELLDYIEERLSSDDIARVEAHLAGACSSCQEEMAWLANTIKLMAPNLWVDAPSRLQATVQKAYREQFNQKSEPFSLGRWLESLFTPARPLVYAAVGIVLVVIVLGLLLQPWSDASPSNTAAIAAYTGTVVVESAETGDVQSAEETSSVNAGDAVRTGDESSVVISFPDESKTLMAPRTELSVVKMSLNQQRDEQVVILQQDSGRTQNFVQPLRSIGSRFEIRTPVATVSVRGTSFTVDVEEDGTTRVSVAEGRVQVAAQGITVTLDPGEGTVVEAGGAPETAQPVPTVAVPTELATLLPSPVVVPTDEPIARPTSEKQEAAETPEPSDTPSVRPSATPSPSVTPSVTPSATPVSESPTAVPTASQGSTQPTPEPTATNTPSAPPTETPEPPPPPPTEEPTPTPLPTATEKVPPGQTKTPMPPTRKAPPPGQSNKS